MLAGLADPSTFWLTFTNAALGLAVAVFLVSVCFSSCFALIGRLRSRRASAEVAATPGDQDASAFARCS